MLKDSIYVKDLDSIRLAGQIDTIVVTEIKGCVTVGQDSSIVRVEMPGIIAECKRNNMGSSISVIFVTSDTMENAKKIASLSGLVTDTEMAVENVCV